MNEYYEYLYEGKPNPENILKNGWKRHEKAFREVLFEDPIMDEVLKYIFPSNLEAVKSME